MNMAWIVAMHKTKHAAGINPVTGHSLITIANF